MTLADRVDKAVGRMMAAEYQRWLAGEMPGHSPCECGHIIRDEWMAFHQANSPLHITPRAA